jgi:hypothetical protein
MRRLMKNYAGGMIPAFTPMTAARHGKAALLHGASFTPDRTINADARQ